MVSAEYLAVKHPAILVRHRLLASRSGGGWNEQTSQAEISTKRPKTKLGFPDLDHSKAAVLDSLRSPESKHGYRYAIDKFIQWYCSEPRLSFNKIVVTRYRIFLENHGLAPVRSTVTLPLCVGWHTRPPMPACSAPSSRQVSVV